MVTSNLIAFYRGRDFIKVYDVGSELRTEDNHGRYFYAPIIEDNLVSSACQAIAAHCYNIGDNFFYYEDVEML